MLNIFYEESEINNVFWKKLNKDFFGNSCVLKSFRRINELVPMIFALPEGVENNNLLIELEPGYFDYYIDEAIRIKNTAKEKGVNLFISQVDSIEEVLISCGYTEVLCENSFNLINYASDFAELSSFLCENEDKEEIKNKLIALAVKIGLCVRGDMSNKEISRRLINAFNENDNILSEAEFVSEFIDELLQSMDVFGIEKKWLSFEQCSELSRLGIGLSNMKEMSSRYKNLDTLIKALISDNELFMFKGGYKMKPEILRDCLDLHFKALYKEKISPVLTDDYFDVLMGKFRETAILSFARAYFKSREKILFEYSAKVYNQGLSEQAVFSVFKEWNTDYVRYILYEKAEKEELDG